MGIDCAENVVNDNILSIVQANGEFSYRIFNETQKNCYIYGEQQLQRIRRGDRLGSMGGATPNNWSADRRRVAESYITAQLGEISQIGYDRSNLHTMPEPLRSQFEKMELDYLRKVGIDSDSLWN